MHSTAIRAWSVAALTAFMAPSLAAQGEVTIDWANGSAMDAGAVDAGKSVAFQLRNADRVCYSYKLTFTQPETADRTSEIGTLLGLSTTRTVPDGPEQPASERRLPETPAPPDTANRFMAMGDDVLVVALTDLTARTERASAALDGAIGKVADAYQAAVEAEAAALTCPSPPRPRGVAAAQLRQRWRATMLPPLEKVGQAVARGTADYSAAGSLLTSLTAELDPLLAAFDAKTELRTQHKAELDALATRLEETLPDKLATLGARLAEARAGAAELRATGDLLDKPVRQVIRVKDTADSLSVTVAAFTQDASGTSKEVSRDTAWVGVSGGGPLVYFTTGYFFSSLKAPRYEVVLIPAMLDSFPDSTLSTYADRTGESRATAPFIAANLRVLRLGRSLDLAVSFGTGLRSVDGQSKLDLLFGLSGLIARTIAVSGGLHRGDREYLLLDQAVLDAGVSPKLTRESVVGVKTEIQGFLGVSIRLPSVGG